MLPEPPQEAPFAAVDVALRALCPRVGLLGAATPRDAAEERRRLHEDFERGRERLPVWTYEPSPRTDILADLDALLEGLEELGDARLASLYRERIVELRVEALAAEAVGTPLFAERARARFDRERSRAEADRLAHAWLARRETTSEAAGARVWSDERDSRSLVSRLRAEVTRQRLPFTVRTSPALAALAAVSGDTIWVAEARALLPVDVERTVMHEIEAHVVPRVRAKSLSLGLFSIGTAHGSDEQEGYALWLEEKRGFATVARCSELAARHVAVTLMQAGDDFVGVVRTLHKELGVSLEVALRTAERAFRGSHGKTPGLGRERVYLCSYLRVKEHLASRPEDENVLRAGQVAVAAVDAVRAWAGY